MGVDYSLVCKASKEFFDLGKLSGEFAQFKADGMREFLFTHTGPFELVNDTWWDSTSDPEYKEWKNVEKSSRREPPPGLLMSMALLYDYGLGYPGYYDEMKFGELQGPSHAQRLESTLATMRQLFDEIVGQGFYSTDKEEFYAAMKDRATT